MIATFEGLGHPFILMALEGCKRTLPGHVVQATTDNKVEFEFSPYYVINIAPLRAAQSLWCDNRESEISVSFFGEGFYTFICIVH